MNKNYHYLMLALIFVLGATSMFFATQAHYRLAEVKMHRSQPKLPYTEPHEIFVDQTGTKCAGWHFTTHNLSFVICENRPPLIIDMTTNTNI